MKEQRSMNSALTQSTRVGQSPTAKCSNPEELLSSKTSEAVKHRVLWIDGVGAYLLTDKEEVVIGQAIAGSHADIQIVGDLSRQAAAIRRSGSDYLLQPLQTITVNGQAVDRPVLLNDQSEIQFGDRVRLAFAKPNPLSATATLRLASLNKLRPNVDGILLLAESCVLGPSAGSHVRCPTWSNELLMFRHGDQWFFRTLHEVEVNGKTTKGQIEITEGLRLQGDDFSLTVE